jgi:hypothetical protein
MDAIIAEWKERKKTKKFEDLLTAYMVARDRVETENRKYGLFEEKPTFDVAIQERREARQKLLAYVEELEAERRLIPVSERLPELNQDVFGLVDGVIVVGSFYQDLEYGIYFSDGGSGMLVATHWTYMPELPEAER